MSFRIVDRRDVVPKRPGRYRSFPGLVRLGPGRLLLGYRDARAVPGTYSHGDEGDFMLMRCEGGRWGEPERLYEHQGPVEDMSCGDLTLLPDGTITLFTREWDAARRRTHGTYLSISTDGGATFTPRRRIDVAGFHEWWVPYGKVIELPGGEWLLGAYGRRSEGDGMSGACLESADHGRTWSVRGWVGQYGCIGTKPIDEPLIFRLPGGELFVLIRTNGLFYSSRSLDDGRTWAPPTPAFEGMAGAGTVLSTGELLVTYRGIHHDGPPPEQRVPLWPRRGRLYCCRATADGGRTWTPELSLDDHEAVQVGSYGMGDAVELEDGRVQVVFYTSDADQTPWIEQVILERE